MNGLEWNWMDVDVDVDVVDVDVVVVGGGGRSGDPFECSRIQRSLCANPSGSLLI